MQQHFRSAKILFALLTFSYFLASCNDDRKCDADEKIIAEQRDTIKQLKNDIENMRLSFLQGAPQQLKGDIINIRGYDVSKQTLTLTDQFNNPGNAVSVKRNQTIKWQINNTDLQIVSIDIESNWINDDKFFFQIKPQQGENAQNWRAVVRDLPDTSGSAAHYYIKWRLKADPNKIYTYDPLMQLNPAN